MAKMLPLIVALRFPEILVQRPPATCRYPWRSKAGPCSGNGGGAAAAVGADIGRERQTEGDNHKEARRKVSHSPKHSPAEASGVIKRPLPFDMLALLQMANGNPANARVPWGEYLG